MRIATIVSILILVLGAGIQGMGQEPSLSIHPETIYPRWFSTFRVLFVPGDDETVAFSDAPGDTQLGEAIRGNITNVTRDEQWMFDLNVAWHATLGRVYVSDVLGILVLGNQGLTLFPGQEVVFNYERGGAMKLLVQYMRQRTENTEMALITSEVPFFVTDMPNEEVWIEVGGLRQRLIWKE